MYRNTYLEINLKNIENNVRNIIKQNNNYKYYFSVVKADCYGHGIHSVKSIIKGGCNYLAVATLEEAIEIRKIVTNIPILCLGIIPVKYIKECIKYNITITISNIDYLKSLIKEKHDQLKVHIKIDTGMNRLGVNDKNSFNDLYKIIKENHLILEGIYTHIHSPLNKEITLKQFEQFEEITSDINLEEIPIIHLSASNSVVMYPKPKYANGCRLGIIMYGFANSKKIKLLPTFSLYSEIIQINNVKKGETVGYDGKYKTNSLEQIAIVPIGYADGIIRKNTERNVFINNKEYKIVGNICMDMLFVKVDDTVNIGDKVCIIKDIEHINKIAKHLDTIPYEVMCSISKRVLKKYVN